MNVGHETPTAPPSTAMRIALTRSVNPSTSYSYARTAWCGWHEN